MNRDQNHYSECEQCGAPLVSRDVPCPSCHARSVPAYAAMVPTLTVRLTDARPPKARRLPARRVWSPTRALANPYAVVEDAAIVQSTYQRMREPLALAASALIVASAVYVGFIHNQDSDADGDPITVSGAISRPKSAPPVLAVQRPETAAPARATAVTAAPRVDTAPRLPAASTAESAAFASLPARRTAPAASAAGTTSAAPATAALTTASAQAKRNPDVAPPLTPEEKARADLARHLRAARASLQNNNLSATKARVAAAIAVQPQSRDAQNLRAAVNTREQQRDALLSLARGCGHIGRWDCVSLNAGSALGIDSSSKEARHLMTLAAQESALDSARTIEPTTETAADTRDINLHH
ncbi:hypothetical protein PQR11_24540 [Paraburkholderia strydomiana]|uniref:hypothetical protein n=1 Tax=Paraburkholderia strydomiana TaxID=1245417 RepID=UPI0038BAADED